MSGYRQTSFDPNAGAHYGPPLRPYNWVQWSGVVLMALGFLVLIAFAAAKAGLIGFRAEDSLPLVGSNMVLCGTLLQSSRREEASAPSIGDIDRRWVLLGLLVLSAALGAAIAILSSKGA